MARRAGLAGCLNVKVGHPHVFNSKNCTKDKKEDIHRSLSILTCHFCFAAVVCEIVPPVENANVSPEKESYQYRDSIKYSCYKDYTLLGNASLTCTDAGEFTPNPPECRRKCIYCFIHLHLS